MSRQSDYAIQFARAYEAENVEGLKAVLTDHPELVEDERMTGGHPITIVYAKLLNMSTETADLFSDAVRDHDVPDNTTYVRRWGKFKQLKEAGIGERN